MHFNETEKLRLLARCWNNLDISFIENELSQHIVYNSQWVLTPIMGKEKLLDYLYAKFSAINSARLSGPMFVKAEIGVIPSLQEKPCIVLSQSSTEYNRQVTILIEVQDDLIIRIEICFIPTPEEVELTGDIPI